MRFSIAALIFLVGCGDGDDSNTSKCSVNPRVCSMDDIARDNGYNVLVEKKPVSPIIADPVKTRQLTVYKIGIGLVTSDQPGINCGEACLASYYLASNVILTAVAPPGYSFLYWNGSCSGNNPTCSVSMSDAQIATAVFTSMPALNNRVDCMLNWAEKQFSSDYWPPAKSQVTNGYYARYYTGSRNYLAYNLTDSHLYYVDPAGYTYDYGSINSYLYESGC